MKKTLRGTVERFTALQLSGTKRSTDDRPTEEVENEQNLDQDDFEEQVAAHAITEDTVHMPTHTVEAHLLTTCTSKSRAARQHFRARPPSPAAAKTECAALCHSNSTNIPTSPQYHTIRVFTQNHM